MAHPEAVVPLVPETLPEDFSDWDGEASPASLPGKPVEAEPVDVPSETPRPRGQSNSRDGVRSSAPRTQRLWGSDPPAPIFGRQQDDFVNRHASSLSGNAAERDAAYGVSENPKPVGQSVEREAMLSPTVDRPRDSWAASSATVVAEPQKLTSALPDELPVHAAKSLDDSHTANGVSVQPGWSNTATVGGARNVGELSAAKMREADEAIYQLFSSKQEEVVRVRKPSRNKWVMVAAAGAFSILLSFVLTIVLGHHGAKTAANQSAQPLPEATSAPLQTGAAKPLAGQPFTQGGPRATSASQQTTNGQPAQDEDGAAPAQQTVTETQTKMMNDQLSAPRMIQQGAAKQVSEDAPPPVNLGSAGADGLGAHGALPNVFSGNGKSVVQAPPVKPRVISSGVAVGMLIHKIAPAYPPIAKAARVSGTVVLDATISKTGAITDLHLVSGPEMLRQAALDAVRAWRYKPYTLNNEPTDVETTINVVFTLGN
jgi:protein TonB